MEYSDRTYSEIVGVLFALGNKYISKLPETLISNLMKKTYGKEIPHIDKEKRIEEQNFTEDTYTFLTMLKLNYWCETEEEKNELIEILRNNEREYPNASKEKNDLNTIFNKKSVIQDNNKISKNESKDTKLVTVKKKGFFTRILDRFRALFNKGKKGNE